MDEYQKTRSSSEEKKDRRIREIYNKLPNIELIDVKIRDLALEMSKEIIRNPERNMEIVKSAKEKIERLKMEKAFILTEANIDLEYMEIDYSCKKCKDTGYLQDGRKCYCFKQRLVNRAYKMSNLENILEVENFDNFNIELFEVNKFKGEELSPRENIMDILSIAEGFVSNFAKNNGENLLFYGTTGLGKTYMSNCIAKALLDKGHIVIYQTAFTILEILENRRFGKGDPKLSSYQYELLFDADLLIIDDLGTEVSNTFTNAEIFNIVNTRLIRGKKTIISTNLTPKEITETYTDRVFSRIFHKFLPLKFYGKDIRWE